MQSTESGNWVYRENYMYMKLVKFQTVLTIQRI